MTPKSPDHITFGKVWPAVLSHHVVRLTDLNTICADLRKKNELLFPNWQAGKRAPKEHYFMQRP